ncbi:MAG TPA: dTDP-glucose 4,6-dehydratase [Verrucomicrobiae bacterium]|nr:dTDP-glucose 4,6-dehydratase [Verrucomicrobiae bacterium]
MKLLITGGTGFIGGAFIRMWHREHPDDTIVNLDLLTYAANPKALADVEKSDKYTFIHGDIADPVAVKKAMEGADWVVHFAAETHVDRSITGPAAFVRTNILGTHTLLEAARDAGVKRFHHISTDEVFGELELTSTDKFSETTPYHPHSPYSASKAGADHLVRAYFRTFGLPVTISNCTNNYGPWQHPEKLIPHMVGKALDDEKLPVYGKGENVRDWIHVEDHCRGIALILEKGKVGETYCLGGDAERTNLQIVKEILGLTGKDESLISFVEDRAGHDLRYAIDSSKAVRELGWERRHTFETGLGETVQWYMDHPEVYA